MKKMFIFVLLLGTVSTYANGEDLQDCPTLNDITCGEKVFDSLHIRSVKAIANGEFLLSDGNWYTPEEVQTIDCSH